MSPEISMWCYPWDLVDDGIDEVLAEMKEQLGLSAVSIATHHHSIEHYRPHTRGGLIYRSDAALYFPPDLMHYRETRIRQQPAAMLANAGNPLLHTCGQASALGLDAISWTVTCHASSIGEQYPDCTVKNAVGDRYPEALCPANPDVRAFLIALCRDLSLNYKLSLLELEGCHYPAKRHFHRHERVACQLGPGEHFLLGLCFCEHCRARAGDAGIDVDKVQAKIAVLVCETIESQMPLRHIQRLIDDTAELADFITMRSTVVTELLRDIREASQAPISPIVCAPSVQTGLASELINDFCESITITAYTADVDEKRTAIKDAICQVGNANQVRVGFELYGANCPSQDALIRLVDSAIDEGISRFSFYNYGIAPRANLEWAAAAAAHIRKRLG